MSQQIVPVPSTYDLLGDRAVVMYAAGETIPKGATVIGFVAGENNSIHVICLIEGTTPSPSEGA